MYIEQLDGERILISLCDEELELYSVSFDELGIGERNSDIMLKDLLERAEEETGIAIRDKHIFIEAMRFEKGCLLLVTVSEKSAVGKAKADRNADFSAAYRFEDAEALLGCIRALCRIDKLRCESSLLEHGGSYYLVLNTKEPLDRTVSDTLLEFGSAAGRGRCFEESLYEHARVITPEGALELIGSAVAERKENTCG